MKKKELWMGSVVCLGFFLISCGEGRFDTSGKGKNDSLFLGISMGMEKKAFYDYCWEMNRKKIFIHGPTNQSVEYRLGTELNSPVSMQFYPSFYDERIYEMPVLFNYEAWAPWNKQFSADTLFVKMLSLFKKWYGDDFKTLQHPTMGTVYYQMKGRRRINLFIRDDQYVQAVFTNLKVEKEIKDKKEKSHSRQ